MKINELVKTGERTEERSRSVPIFDEEGTPIGEQVETYTEIVPIMEVVSREATEEELENWKMPAKPSIEEWYQKLVERYIRVKYTSAQEFAILRQRDTKPDEFATYNAFCESCKAKAKKEMGV